MNSTILLVDDHGIVRQGMATLLSTTDDLTVVGEAGDGLQAIEIARELTPDVVVLDILMPGMTGVAVIPELRAVSPRSKIAVLTSSEDNELAFAAIEAGAHAFLLKSMAGDEILLAIRRVIHDEVVIHPQVTQRILGLVRTMRQPRIDPFAVLSERERDVLRSLAQGASNARLAETLAISIKTVKTHIGKILDKLELTDRTEAVAFAWRHGLIQQEIPLPDAQVRKQP